MSVSPKIGAAVHDLPRPGPLASFCSAADYSNTLLLRSGSASLVRLRALADLAFCGSNFSRRLSRGAVDAGVTA
jgi:hypothetical protein